MEQQHMADESKCITAELLQNAIRYKEGCDAVHINEFEVEQLFIPNMVSRLFRVRVDAESNGNKHEHRLFIKVIRENKIVKQVVLIRSKFYQKEEMSYGLIIPDMIKFQRDLGKEEIGPSVPAYYYSKADSSTGIMILEDLMQHGYVMGSRQNGLEYEQCVLALGELARFHALSFAIKAGSVENLRKYEHLFHESLVRVPQSPYLTNGFRVSIQLLNTFIKDEDLKNAVGRLSKLDLQKTMCDLIKPKEPYAVICHGDFGPGNVVFKYSDRSHTNPFSAKLVDLQLVRYALPTTDLAHFFFLGTTRTLRQQHMKSLLHHYHETFMESLATVKVEFREFTFEVLEKMFEETALFGIIIALMLFPTMFKYQNKSESSKFEVPSAAEIENTFETLFTQLLEVEKDALWIKDRMIGVMEDAAEMGVI